MIYIVVIVIIIYLLYLLVVKVIIPLIAFSVTHVIAPVAGILLVVAVTGAVVYGLYTSLVSFITSLLVHINPYTTYVDKSLAAHSETKRNYFFGPGYHQISITVKEALSFQKDRLKGLGDWKDSHTGNVWFLDMWIYIFYGVAVFCASVLGFAWIAVFSMLMPAVLIPVMCVFYVFFALFWGADRLILMFKAIQSRCPECKRISIVPVFICPNCGRQHKKLTPGPYGILTQKCSCEKRLPATCFNGRSRYKAVCPFCDSGLAASDARQFGIQLVGAKESGKTSFLAAFWHEYLEWLKTVRGISITTTPEDEFVELEHWFQNGNSSGTAETNANMYSVIHKEGKKTPVQMTVYDIAGEAFLDFANNIQQQQFQYCEGIVFVIDPTAPPTRISDTVSGFIYEFEGLKGLRSIKASDVPVVVLITKADLYRQEIGLPKISASFNSDAQKYADTRGNTSKELVRNGICRVFLNSRGFSNAVNLIDAKFNKVQYYPVSAMGHPAAFGQKYEPWGVLEPIAWLLQQHGALFQNILSSLKI
jgi:GTPase SAR1 family protein